MEIKGQYNTAKVFTDNIDEVTIAQVTDLCNQSFTSGEDIRIMPDCHAGAGCVIGTTMTLRNKKVVPNLVGVDIGCGMHVVFLGKEDVDLRTLDDIIHNEIPSGFSVRNIPHRYSKNIGDITADVGDMARHIRSIGTLGGGNHFIELNKDDYNDTYLVIHSGSRNFGKVVAEYWQNKAVETCLEETSKALAYLSGELYTDYIHDMAIAQDFAYANRLAIADVILTSLGIDYYCPTFTTTHNYISMKDGLLRKGAVSAKKGEVLIIPLNMRDGSIIAVGKGNADWNNSAPHGAGRILSRAKAKREVNMADFRESMKGVYSTTVNESTLDESPMAYKDTAEILQNIGDTVEVSKIIKPIYNFKNSQG